MKHVLQGFLLQFGRLLAFLLGGMKVEGRENVPLDGPVILVPNHFSDIDPPVVGIALPRRAWYMAKSELFQMFFIGPFIRFMQAYPVRRNFADRTALRYTEELLERGEAVVLFPEGKLSETGELQPFLPGAALLALRSKAAVIPVGLVGTPEMLPYGKLIPRRSSRPIQVKFGRPLEMDDLYSLPRAEAVAEATRRMETAVARLTGLPMPIQAEEEQEKIPVGEPH